MNKFNDKQRMGLKLMMRSFIKDYKTSNPHNVDTREFLRNHISFLGKMWGKEQYNQEQKEKLNYLRDYYLEKQKEGR